MTDQNIQSSTQFQISTQNNPIALEKKSHYGWWVLAVFLLVNLLEQIHSIDLFIKYPILAPTYMILGTILGGATWYFLVLWILEMVRLRGGIVRPKNEGARKTFAYVMIAMVIFAIVGMFLFVSLFGFSL